MNENTSLLAALLRALSRPDFRQHLEDFLRYLFAPDSDCMTAPDYWECLDLLATVERYVLNPDSHALALAALKMLVGRRAAVRPADARSPWQKEYTRLTQSVARAMHRPPEMELTVETGDRILARFVLPGEAFERTVGDIQPGQHRIATDTGWQLWSGDLFESDLILGAAKPRRLVTLAAQDVPTQAQPTRTFGLGQTGLQAAVFPGFESGAIRIYRSTNEGAK